MIKHKPTVTIGIPAYNEEANIAQLLRALLKQDTSNFVLKEIIVVSDQSTDNTVGEVKSVKSKKIVLLKNLKRKGQALSQNKMFERANTDIVILLNADTLPVNNKMLGELVKEIIKNKKIGIVGGKPIPVAGKSLFERIINKSVDFKYSLFVEKNNGDNIYLCHGRVRAFSKALYKNMRWEKVFGEDAFSYLYCKRYGLAFRFAPKALVYYRSPETLSDHLMQSTRFIKSSEELAKYFSIKTVRSEYKLDIIQTIRVYWRSLYVDPLALISYLCIYILAHLYVFSGIRIKVKWRPSLSTKHIKPRSK